jgi:hypothetical protein
MNTTTKKRIAFVNIDKSNCCQRRASSGTTLKRHVFCPCGKPAVRMDGSCGVCAECDRIEKQMRRGEYRERL